MFDKITYYYHFVLGPLSGQTRLIMDRELSKLLFYWIPSKYAYNLKFILDEENYKEIYCILITMAFISRIISKGDDIVGIYYNHCNCASLYFVL